MEELTKKRLSELVDEFGKSENYQKLVSDMDSVLELENEFVEAVSKKRKKEEKYSELERVKAWLDFVLLLTGYCDESHAGGKEFKRFLIELAEKAKLAVIHGRDLSDKPVYTEIDWERFKFWYAREAKNLLSACSSRLNMEHAKETNEKKVDSGVDGTTLSDNPYKK